MKKVINADTKASDNKAISEMLKSIKVALNSMDRCKGADLSELDPYVRSQFWKAYEALAEIENKLS